MSILYFRKINWRLKNTDIFTLRMVPRNFGLCKNSGSFSRKFKYLILAFKVSAKSIKHRCKKNFYCNSFFFTAPPRSPFRINIFVLKFTRDLKLCLLSVYYKSNQSSIECLMYRLSLNKSDIRISHFYLFYY